jgi:hypothetical protein
MCKVVHFWYFNFTELAFGLCFVMRSTLVAVLYYFLTLAYVALFLVQFRKKWELSLLPYYILPRLVPQWLSIAVS